MGQTLRTGTADQFGLARVDRERRWTAIVDLVLAVVALGWLGALRLGALGGGVRWGVSLVLLAMVVHRALLLVERLRRRRRAQPAVALVEVEPAPGVRAA